MYTSVSVHISSGLEQEHMVVWPWLSPRVSVVLPPSLSSSWPNLEPPPAVPLRPCFHCPAYSSSTGLCHWCPEVCYFVCKWPFKGFSELFSRRENPLWCFKKVDVSSSHQAIRWLGCGFLQLSGRQQIIRQGGRCVHSSYSSVSSQQRGSLMLQTASRRDLPLLCHSYRALIIALHDCSLQIWRKLLRFHINFCNPRP